MTHCGIFFLLLSLWATFFCFELTYAKNGIYHRIPFKRGESRDKIRRVLADRPYHIFKANDSDWTIFKNFTDNLNYGAMSSTLSESTCEPKLEVRFVKYDREIGTSCFFKAGNYDVFKRVSY